MLEFEDVLDLVGLVVLCGDLEMVAFFAEFAELELEESVYLVDIVDDDVVGVVEELSRADLDLLDVAEVGVSCAADDGDAGIKEVDEFGGTGEVVLRDGFVAPALGRVGDDDDGKVVLLLQADHFHHELAGGGSFLGVVAGEGDVVQDEEAGATFGGVLNGVQDGFLQIFSDDELGVDFGPLEVVGEHVDLVGYRVGVAHLELLVGKFEVDEEERLSPGDFFGNLGDEDGLAYAGGSEDDGAFVLDDETVEEGAGVWTLAGVLDPVVGFLDGEDAALFGCAFGFLYLLLDAFDWVEDFAFGGGAHKRPSSKRLMSASR